MYPHICINAYVHQSQVSRIINASYILASYLRVLGSKIENDIFMVTYDIHHGWIMDNGHGCTGHLRGSHGSSGFVTSFEN